MPSSELNDLIKDCFKDGEVRVDLNVDGHAPVTFDGRFPEWTQKLAIDSVNLARRPLFDLQKESARRGTRIRRSFGERKAKGSFAASKYDPFPRKS